jgi:hypothetical protein
MSDEEIATQLINERQEILILVDKLYNDQMQRAAIEATVYDINMRIRLYPEGLLKDSMMAKIQQKYRYAPLKNDTGILDYTGHGRPFFH